MAIVARASDAQGVVRVCVVRSPIAGARVPTRGAGAWLARRSDGRRLHAGIDLSMNAETPCLAPEAGEVVSVFESNRPRAGAVRFSRPSGFSGYGPRGLVLRGDSGVWHLLGHLDVVGVRVGERVAEGQEVGRGSVVHHVHWEVRERVRPAAGQAVVEVTLDPVAWLRGERVAYAGQCPETPGTTVDTPRACRPTAGRRATEAPRPFNQRGQKEPVPRG